MNARSKPTRRSRSYARPVLLYALAAGAALLLAFSIFATATGAPRGTAEITLLNVSYDPTRELYQDLNKAFAAYWKDKTGDIVTIKQSHGGSGKRARSVIDGIDADVVTLALAFDIDALAERRLAAGDWQQRPPERSAPYLSTIVPPVRKGNPNGIVDWDDIARPGVSVIVPNAKTSGGATVTFAERGVGDVLLAGEYEVDLAKKEFGADRFDIVIPSISVLAEPPVALVDKVVDKRGTRRVAEAYLQYFYSDERQEVAARNFYRPRSQKVAAKYATTFPKLSLFTVDDTFGGWARAQKTHFADGGVFDQIHQPGGK